MTNSIRALVRYFLLFIGFVFMLPLLATGLPGDTHALRSPDSSDSLWGDTVHVNVGTGERQLRGLGYPSFSGESLDGSPNKAILSTQMRLAQTLPFQAPSTPEIEPQQRTGKPSQGEGRPGDTSTQVGRAQKAEGSEKKVGLQGNRKQPRTATPTTTGAQKRKRSDVKSQSSSPLESQSGKRTVDSTGFQPLSQPPLSRGTATPSASSLPPLPPGLPYSAPGAGRGAGLGTTPGTRDTFSTPNPPSAGLAKPKPSDTGLPSAKPIGPGGSLDNFVLDSFKAGTPQAARLGQETDPKAPPGSLFGQLSQDMKQLGEGIKETFRSLLSLR